MKIPLRYQNTEYDCGTTSFVNALAYLYDREDIPIELLKEIYKLTLDVKNLEGITWKGGTSTHNAELLAKHFVDYANKNDEFNLKCKILNADEVDVESMKKSLNGSSVIIARCWHGGEHYVLITKMDDIFDPYYLEEDYYTTDNDVAIVLHETFSHNRLVKIERLFDEDKKDFSLLEKDKRSIIVNTARQELIDKEYLYSILKQGKINTVAMDGFYIEPITPTIDDKFLDLNEDKYILTPHNAYNSSDAVFEMERMIIESLIK